jgi:hypothetical protein
MIIVDFSGTIVAALMVNVYLNPNEPVSEERIRWSVLSSLKNYKSRYGKEYGQLVVACDGQNYWRKEIFPYYKVKRKINRDADKFDWTHMFAIVKVIREEIKKYLPYPVIEVDRAEGDDVIAALVEMIETSTREPVLIISRDKDLKQLQKHSFVKQYNPVDKRWEVCNNASEFLAEHILIGDTGDSIPNAYSPDNSIALGIRQKSATEKRKALGKAGALPDRYELNEKLIDLGKIPNDIVWAIIEEYEVQINKNKGKLLFYLTSHGLDTLAASIQDFG